MQRTISDHFQLMLLGVPVVFLGRNAVLVGLPDGMHLMIIVQRIVHPAQVVASSWTVVKK